jgi:outer membrane protein assembly factor BamB
MSILLRDTRASYDSLHFGASLEQETITIWRSDSPLPVTTVKPSFSGGGRRHFIDPVNRLIYAGTWENGLTCFDYADTRVVWYRDDLIGIQTVDLSAGFPSSVFVTLEAPDYRLDEPGIISGIVELDAKDGSAKWAANDGDWVYLHPRQPLIVIQDRCNNVVRILDGEKNEVGSIPMVHFAIIDVGFGKGMIALAEGEKGVRIFDDRGALVSRYAPKGRKPNCIKVAFYEDRVIVFDSWDGSFLIIIDPRTGKLIAEYEREFHDDICFIDDGSRFIDSSGQIYRSSDGRFVTTVKAEQGGAGNGAPRRA